VPDEVSPLGLGAVAEVFGVDPGLAPDWYEFSVCGSAPGPNTSKGGLQLVIDRGLEALAEADTIVVLPVSQFTRERPGEYMLGLLADAAARGCRIVSVCIATFVLAAAGLLDHRRATTHWRFCAALAAAYPSVHVVPDALYVDEGNILTSGGVAAVIDLCLHVVRKDYGADAANRLARQLVAGPHRDGAQAQFIEQPVPDADGRRIGPALAWALQHLAERPDPDRLAVMAAMSRRTFYREFRTETGTTPHRWLVAQQVVLAQRMLETSRLSVAEIARRCGFGDVSVFRRHFTAKTGLSPVAYRRAYGQVGA
jgi:AraC family transcriptional activator FtrA